MDIFKFIGAVGLVLISAGVLVRKRKQEDFLYILGGICLEIYSIHIGDTIFIILQIIFTLVAVYDFFRKRISKKHFARKI